MAETKRRPRTGEKRRTNQPLKIDRLPVEIRDIIQHLKNGRGKTWIEIEELSSLPYDDAWSKRDTWLKANGGFVQWETLPTPVLEMFPDLRIPHTNLHRWYDLRVSQVTAETIARSAQARVLAAAFAKSQVKGGDESVLNAARDQLMSLIAENASPEARIAATKGLIALAERMQMRRANDIKERKVSTDERKLNILEEREARARERLAAETETAAKKVIDGRFSLDDVNRIRERVFGLPPIHAVTDGN
jgi:hypothetical protein